MEQTDTLTYFFKHHLWANLRLLEYCAQLTGEQMDGAIEGTMGSILETWRHIARAEQSYFSRVSTGQMFIRPEDEAPMTLAGVKSALSATGEGFIEWAARVQPADMVTLDWSGRLREVPKTVILSQAIYHGIEHRAQIMVTMTQLGIQPPDLQSWVYFDEMDG